jgi:adenylate cyclase
MHRKLAAILAADMVGYSAHMERDEQGTHERLKAARTELIEPEIARLHGRVFKLMGDGMLAEFGSVVDAVECAVALQRGLAERNAAVPDDQRIQVRIGINLGEVIVEGDDRYGEGVNIASRLQQLADVGGICVSDKVAKEVEKKLAFGFEPMGQQRMKNIEEPVQAFRVTLDGAQPKRIAWAPAGGTRVPGGLNSAGGLGLAACLLTAVALVWMFSSVPATVDPKLIPPPGKPSLAVLPFGDLGGGQAYFADGITEDLITDLSKLSGIFVISRNATWAYRGKTAKVQQVAADLGVRYVLDGSVRRDGDTVRINVQLVDANGGQQLWAERYDGSMTEVFALQDKVVGRIVAALAVNLTTEEQAKVAAVETQSAQAYDAVIKGWSHYRKGTEADNNKAIALFEAALGMDPTYSRAHAALGAAYWQIARSEWESATEVGFQRAYDRALDHLAKAQKEPNPLAYAISAEIAAKQGQYDEAFTNIGRALSFAPGDPDIYVAKARILNATGRAVEAEAAVRSAMRLDPKFPPDYLRVLANSLFHQERYREVIEIFAPVASQAAAMDGDLSMLAASYGHLGQRDAAAKAIASYNDKVTAAGYSPLTVQEGARWWWYGDVFDYHAPYLDQMEAGLRKAGVPEGAGDLTYPQYRAVTKKTGGEYRVDGAVTISLADAKVLRDRGAVFVDVRAPKDFARGHIPGAHNIDVQLTLTWETLAAVADKDAEVVFSCHGKYCPDSAMATAKAVLWGYKRASYFPGGFPAWKDAGYPIETSP